MALFLHQSDTSLEPKDVLWPTGGHAQEQENEEQVLLHLDGVAVLDQNLHLIQLILNLDDPLVVDLSRGLASLFAGEHVAVCLGET